MSDSDNKKPRRALKNLPPDRFQPKMLIFWLLLVAAVLALLWYTPGMANTPEPLLIQDVVERAEAGNIKAAQPTPVIQPDQTSGRDTHIITGESRKDDKSPY